MKRQPIMPGDLLQLCRESGELLRPPATGQWLVRVEQADRLADLAAGLAGRGFYLVTFASTDERQLLDRSFKQTYLWSSPEQDLFIFATYVLGRDAGQVRLCYPDIASHYTALIPLQGEAADMIGLLPTDRPVERGLWLHPECYPPDLHPLWRNLSVGEIAARIAGYTEPASEPLPLQPKKGEWMLPVGPIHAGVIEPGRFLFRLSGETVEDLHIRLGYTHKGIERLFQQERTLEDGWQLAERVAGDSAFAHSLAYCRAAESLAGMEPADDAQALRALFLELERMAAHMGDCAALAHDVSADVASAELMACRERLLDLNGKIAGHRLLRGLNRPGGVALPRPLDAALVVETVQRAAEEFAQVSDELVRWPAFRSRLQWQGILTRKDALRLGATGLAARASGVWRDFRIQHPVGIEQVFVDLLSDRQRRGWFVPADIDAPDALLSRLCDMAGRPAASEEQAAALAIIGFVVAHLERAGGLLAHEALNELLGSSELARLGRLLLAARPQSEVEGELWLSEPEAHWDLSRLNRLLLELALEELDILHNTHEIADKEATAGDALARFLTRVQDVEASRRLIGERIAPLLPLTGHLFVAPLTYRTSRNYEFAVGWAEGWRGDVVYWLMQDTFGRIFRCKVRDPSVFNWPALRAAVVPHVVDALYDARYRPPLGKDGIAQIIVNDFPIINKSFSASYSGNDL